MCELHFSPENIVRSSEYFDTATGKHYSVPLQKPRVKPGAVPSILPNCPQYLSSSVPVPRVSADERRERLENRDIEAAISESLQTQAQYEQERCFVDFNEFLQCLEVVQLPNSWTVIKSDTAVSFILIETKDIPVILFSIVVTSDLKMSLYAGKNELSQLGNVNFPLQISNVNVLTNTIADLNSFIDVSNENGVEGHLQFIQSYLMDLTKLLDEDKKNKLIFICEQISLLNAQKNHYRYSPDFIIFCSILFSISPHAYRFIRSSECLILPHPNTLHKICSDYKINPAMEQREDNFLLYIKQKFKLLSQSDTTISVMIDEIHLKPYLDYTGGNILGAAYNSKNAASSAQVFMIQSLLSSYKDVVHILPVKTIDAEGLHTYINKVVTGLQSLGFKVVCVVTDNNAVNRKAMSFFASPPKLSIVYKHPCDISKPLFYVLDSVHILKCVRNNWINKKDGDQTIVYPMFETFLEAKQLPMAKFSSVKKLHEIESTQIVKYAHKLNLKSLCPNNLERQNVKLVLNVFNEMTVQGLLALGQDKGIDCFQSTADFIALICKWWNIVNVSSPYRDIRFRDVLQKPLSNPSDENFKFLENFLCWLDLWKDLPSRTGAFSNETHLAISHTTHALLELTKYCTEELNFKYLLPGKIQTDGLEARFGKYRTMAGSQYLVSLRQIFEVESKLRIQNLLALKIPSSAFGEIDIDINSLESNSDEGTIELTPINPEYNLDFSEEQFLSCREYMPVFTYLSGYCARAVLKKLKCENCRLYLVSNKLLSLNENTTNYDLIGNIDRGGLLCPNSEVINAVIYTYITVKNLVSEKNENCFLRSSSQRNSVVQLAVAAIVKADFFLPDFSCIQNDHTVEKILHSIVRTACNIFLNNYVKKMNDAHNINSAKRRKILTVK